MIQFTDLDAFQTRHENQTNGTRYAGLLPETTTRGGKKMFGRQSQFNGWDLDNAESAPGFFDDLDDMLQIPNRAATQEQVASSTTAHDIVSTLEESLFKETFELLPEGAVFVGTDGSISRVNQPALACLNQIEERLLGTRFTDLISDSDPQKTSELDDLFERDLTKNLFMTLRAGRKEEVFVSLNARRLYSEETLTCIGFLVTMQEFV